MLFKSSKMKNLRIKLVLVLILAVVAIVLLTQKRTGTLDDDISAFSVDDTTSVTKIYLADMKGNEVLLSRVFPGKWLLNDTLNARTEAVNRLLATMYRMTVQSPVSKAGYNNVITNLATNSVKVEVYQNLPAINLFHVVRMFYREKLSKVFYVGQPTPDNLGTFMMIEGSNTPFIVYLPGLRGFLSARFSANPNDWRDHTIFAKNPQEIFSIQVDFPSFPEESYRIEKPDRNTLRVRRPDNNELISAFDTSKVVNLINGYRNIRFESVVDYDADFNKDSVLQSLPVHIITLTDTAGNVQSMKTFRRKNYAKLMDDNNELYPWDMDRMYGLINEGEDFVLIQYFVFDPITRPLSYFTTVQP